MKFTINNIAYASPGVIGSLTVEETAVKNKFVIVDPNKGTFPKGLAFLDISDDVKKGVERTLLRVSVPYTDANGEEQAETVHIVRTGSSLGLIGAPRATWVADVVSNSAASALHGALHVLTCLIMGHASDGVPVTQPGVWTDQFDGTALSDPSMEKRMNNPFIRATLGLAPLEEGGEYNGTQHVSGTTRAIPQT